MKSITPAMASRMRMTHPTAPWGAGPFLPFGRTSLNLAISAMVASRLMRRRRWAVVVAMVAMTALCACDGKAPMPDVFAETIAGWHRVGGVSSTRDDGSPVKNAEQTVKATYEGPGKLEARIYALPTSAMALDVVQRWTPAADTVFFYGDRFFVVVRWEAADRQALQAFVSELEKKLAADKRR
jgi:hypothetical protein